MRHAIILTVPALLAAGVAAAATVEIEMRPTATVASGNIMLQEVAKVSGVNAKTSTRLAKLSLGSTPLPGDVRPITRRTIAICLRREGILSADITWKGPEYCIVKIHTVTIPARTIVKAGENYLRSLPQLQHDGVKITPENMPKDKDLPAGDVAPTLTASADAVNNPWGRIAVYVKMARNGKIIGNSVVTFKVSSKITAVHATTAIMPAETITAKMVRLQERTLGPADTGKRYVTRKEDIIGKKARQMINANDPFEMTQVIDPFAVQAGEHITIRIHSKTLEITAEAVCLNDGHVGDQVSVRVLLSGKTISCRVSDVGRVERSL